jgi:hypothetical protein
MSELKGPPSELRFTVTVTRKATGKVETFEMIGTPVEQPEEKEDDERNPQHGE